MKKALYLLLSLVVFSSCIDLLDDTCELPVAGMWTAVDNSGFTSQYIEFRNGYYRVYESGRDVYYADKTAWATSKSDFEKVIQEEYSIINRTLHLDNSVSPISVTDNTLSIGSKQYYKLSDFTSKYYSKITCETPKNISYKYTATQLTWNYSIDRRPVGNRITVTTSAEWIKAISVEDNSFSFEIEENNSGKNREAILTLSYPTASPVQIKLEQTYEESKIILDTESTSCDYTGGSFGFSYEIDSPRDGVTSNVTCDAEWITELRDNDGRVSFAIPENNSGSDRTCDIIISYGDVAKTHKVTQTYESPRLEISEKNITIGYQGGKYYVCTCNVVNPRNGCVINATCNADWIKELTLNRASERECKIEVTVLENNSSEPSRTAKIEITYDNISEYCTITQTSDAPKIILSKEGEHCSYEEKSYSFTYSVENPRESYTPEVSCSSSWITSLTENDGVVSYKVKENNSESDRTAEILVTYGNSSAKYIVEQEYVEPAVELYPDKEEFDYQAAEGTIYYKVGNSRLEIEKRISCDADWVTDLKYTGDNQSGKITFKIQENNDSEPSRTAEIVFSYGPVRVRQNITQTSDAPKIILTNGGDTYSYHGSEYSFTYNIENPREALTPKITCSSSWVTGITDKDGRVSFHISENNSGDRRTAEILITYGKHQAKYIVIQEYTAPIVILYTDKDEYDYNSARGSISYHIKNYRKELKMNVSCDAAWITNLQYDIKEDGNIFFDIMENNESELSRSAHFTVTYGLVTERYEITQTSDAPEIVMTNGGQSCNYLEENFRFTYTIKNPRESLSPVVTCSESWIRNITDNNGTVSFTVLENNSGSDRSGEICITYGKTIAKYYIQQTYDAPRIYLVADKDTFDYKKAEGSVFYHIDNYRKDLKINVSTDAKWITILDRNGNDIEGKIFFRIEENNENEESRTANIFLAVGETYSSCHITQTSDSPKIVLDNEGQGCNYEEKAYSFTYSIENPRESVTPSVTCRESWISGLTEDNGTVSFTVKENNSQADRTAEISITYGAASAKYIVHQTYTAPDIDVYSETIEYDYKEASGSIHYRIHNIRNEWKVNAKSDAGWITNVVCKGSGQDGEIYFDIAENNETEPYRTARIIVSYGPVTRYHEITQTSDSPKIALVNEGQGCNYEENAYSFTYSIENPRESVTPSVTCRESWITGITDNNGTVSFIVKENNSKIDRTAEILITYGNASAKYLVHQTYTAPEVFLYSDKEEFDYHASKGSISYHINNNRKELKVAVSCNAGWIKNIEYKDNNEDGTIFFDILENNDNEPYRSAEFVISYGPATDRYTIIQTSDAPIISLKNGGGVYDYKDQSCSFTYDITNPRESLKPTVACSVSWITNLTCNNGVVSFNLQENNSYGDRSDEIRIMYGNTSATYYITQTYEEPSIHLVAEKDTFNYNEAEGSIFYHVNNSRKDLKINVRADKEWITILDRNGNEEEGKIFFRISENNESAESRSANITFAVGETYSTCQITQTSDGPKIVMVNGGQSCNYEEKTYSFTYTIENPRDSYTPAVTCRESWITGLTDNNGNVSFTVKENNTEAERSAEIMITYGSTSAKYFVGQTYTAPEVFLYSDKEEFDYHASKGSISYHINNNRKELKAIVSCKAEWIKNIEYTDNNEDGTISFDVLENNDNEEYRTAEFVIAYGPATDRFYLTQTSNAPEIILNNGGQGCSYEEKSYSFTYSIKNPRESLSAAVECRESWITGIKDNNGTVSFTVLENNSGSDRSGEIRITYGNVSERYYIQQEYNAPKITLYTDKNEFSYQAAQGSVIYHIENSRKNLKVNAVCNADWVTILDCSGNNEEGRVSFSVEENNESTGTRSTQLFVTYGDVSSSINIIQTSDAPIISLKNGGGVYDYKDQSCSFTYDITNPRESLKPTVACSVSWITNLTCNNGVVSFNLQENNSYGDRSDEIRIMYGNTSATYYITQTYEAPSIHLVAEKNTFNYNEAEGSIFYHVNNSRKDLKINVRADKEWITILDRNGNEEEGKIFFRISENNESAESRSANITFAVGETYSTCQITQTSDGPKIVMVNGGQSCNYEEKTYSFTYTIENPRDSYTPVVTCRESWITGLTDNNGNVSFTVKENNSGNDRSGEIRVIYGDTYAAYYVQQNYSAPVIHLVAEKNSFNYNEADGSVFYHIDNSRKDLEINVKADKEWITILNRSGDKTEGRIYFRISENNESAESRSANIHLSVGSTSSICQITQTSDAPEIVLNYEGEGCTYEEKSYGFTYSIKNPRESMGSRVTTNVDWITGLSDNNGNVTFTVKENNSGTDRYGEIQITYGSASAKFRVHQSYTAPNLILSTNVLECNYQATAGKIYYHIDNSRKDLTINLSCGATWVKNLIYQGNDTDGNISFNIDENNDTEPARTAEIIVRYGDTGSRISITQTNEEPKVVLPYGGQSCSYEAKTYSFAYNLENPRSALTPQLSCSDGWVIGLSASDGVVTFSLRENPYSSGRTAEIRISYGNSSAKYIVQQKGR